MPLIIPIGGIETVRHSASELLNLRVPLATDQFKSVTIRINQATGVVPFCATFDATSHNEQKILAQTIQMAKGFALVAKLA